jgi:hypothetical protein
VFQNEILKEEEKEEDFQLPRKTETFFFLFSGFKKKTFLT